MSSLFPQTNVVRVFQIIQMGKIGLKMSFLQKLFDIHYHIAYIFIIYLWISACDCYLKGSYGCHSNGVCHCRDNFNGTKCSECAHGFINFPECEIISFGK